MFHKIMWQHMQRVMGLLITTLLQIYRGIFHPLHTPILYILATIMTLPSYRDIMFLGNLVTAASFC